VPELDDALLDKIVSQSDAQAGRASIRELERLRDDCLVSILQALREHDFAAGAVLKAYEGRLLAEAAGRDAQTPRVDSAGLLRLNEARVRPEWIDFNGHMTESRYLEVFADTTVALLCHIGVDTDYVAKGASYYTVETHLRHLREVGAGEPLHVTTQILAVDPKRLQIFHAIYRSRDDALLATAEQMLLHVIAAENRAAPAPPAILARLEAIAQRHRNLPRPEGVGRRIAMPQPATA
jgi:carnitine 3-dehydrogenase